MSQIAKMVIDDPSKMDILTTQIKKQIISAAIATVNIQAAMTRKNAIANVKNELINRSTFTQRSIQYTRCPLGSAHSLNHVQASVGAAEKADYMSRQEMGGEHKSKSGGNLIIPTDKARGGNKRNRVQKEMYYRGLNRQTVKGPFSPGPHTSTWTSRFIAKSFIANENRIPMKYNNRLIFVNNFKRGDGFVSFEQNFIYNMSHESTYTPATHWLEPASKKPARDGQNIFNKQMDHNVQPVNSFTLNVFH